MTAQPSDAKLRMLEFAYAEILDATKHQDDKINRLLTTVAFLTAASLALAGLNSAGPLNSTFALDAVEVPLAKIALGIFLLGVVATVIMLITSLATPLRFPGEAPDPFKYVGVRASQFYFHEISKTAREGWAAKWDQPEEDLVDEKRRLLVRETHNLALRTEYKYARTNEAVAMLSCSLLFFALAAVLVLISSTSASTSVLHLSQNDRLVLAAVIMGYCFLMLLASVRTATQSMTELSAVRWAKKNWRRGMAKYLFPLAAALVPGLLMALPQQGLWGLAWYVVPGAVALLAMRVLLKAHLGKEADDNIRESLKFWGYFVTAALIVIGAAACFVNSQVWQFALAYSTAFVLLIATIVRSALEQRKRVGDYLRTQKA